MARRIRLALLGIFFASTAALAQHPGKSPTKVHGTEHALLGQWVGTLSTDHGSFGMHVGVTRDSTWHVSVTLDADQPIDAGPVTDVKAESTRLSWAQELRGMRCQSSAVLIAETLKGETSCGHGSLGFVLEKRKR
jgi:hypothetical protein